MDLAQMNIVIGANVAQAEQGLNKVSADLANTALAAQKVDSSIGKASIGFSNFFKSTQQSAVVAQEMATLEAEMQAVATEAKFLAAAWASMGLAVVIIAATQAIGQAISKLEIFRDRAKEVADANNKAAESLAGEVSKVNVLVAALKDENLAREDKKRLIAELQKAAPGYFDNLKLEGDNIENLSKDYLNYGLAITLVAKIRAATALNEKNITAGIEEELKTSQRLILLEQKRAYAEKNGVDVGAQRLKILEDQLEAQTKLAHESKPLLDLITQLQVQLNALGGDPTAPPPAASKALKEIKDKAKELSDFLKVDTNIKDIPSRFINAIAIETGDALATVQRTLDKSPLKFNFPAFEIPEKFKEISAVTDLVKSSFDDLFGSIASGASVFEAIGNELKKLITRIAAAVVEAAILRVILTAFFPAQAGLSQFAFGSLFSSLSGLPNFGGAHAAGGVVTRPSLILAGEAGPERITPLNQISNNGNVIGGQVVFEISGQKLRGILKRADVTASSIG